MVSPWPFKKRDSVLAKWEIFSHIFYETAGAHPLRACLSSHEAEKRWLFSFSAGVGRASRDPTDVQLRRPWSFIVCLEAAVALNRFLYQLTFLAGHRAVQTQPTVASSKAEFGRVEAEDGAAGRSADVIASARHLFHRHKWLCIGDPKFYLNPYETRVVSKCRVCGKIRTFHLGD
jgi:hypothetical protein